MNMEEWRKVALDAKELLKIARQLAKDEDCPLDIAVKIVGIAIQVKN